MTEQLDVSLHWKITHPCGHSCEQIIQLKVDAFFSLTLRAAEPLELSQDEIIWTVPVSNSLTPILTIQAHTGNLEVIQKDLTDPCPVCQSHRTEMQKAAVTMPESVSYPDSLSTSYGKSPC